jgi:hypothetical protein
MTTSPSEKPVFQSGKYAVVVRRMSVPINQQIVEDRAMFCVVHTEYDVVAGTSGQLPDAIRGCIELANAQRLIDSDPYALADGLGSSQSQ